MYHTRHKSSRLINIEPHIPRCALRAPEPRIKHLCHLRTYILCKQYPLFKPQEALEHPELVKQVECSFIGRNLCSTHNGWQRAHSQDLAQQDTGNTRAHTSCQFLKKPFQPLVTRFHSSVSCPAATLFSCSCRCLSAISSASCMSSCLL